MPLLNDAGAVFHGAAPVGAVYARGVKVWPVGGAWSVAKVDASTVSVHGLPNTLFSLDITCPHERDGQVPHAAATGTTDANGDALITASEIWYSTDAPIAPPPAFRFAEVIGGAYAVAADGSDGHATNIPGIGIASWVDGQAINIILNENTNLVTNVITGPAAELTRAFTYIQARTEEDNFLITSETRQVAASGALMPSVAAGWQVVSHDNALLFVPSSVVGQHRALFTMPAAPTVGSAVTTETMVWDSSSAPEWGQGWSYQPFSLWQPTVLYSGGDRVANPPNGDAWVAGPPTSGVLAQAVSVAVVCHYAPV